MLQSEIQEWIDGELRGRETKPFVYQGRYLEISDGWLDALKFGLNHSIEEVEQRYKKQQIKIDIENDFYGAGYLKALKMILEE